MTSFSSFIFALTLFSTIFVQRITSVTETTFKHDKSVDNFLRTQKYLSLLSIWTGCGHAATFYINNVDKLHIMSYKNQTHGTPSYTYLLNFGVSAGIVRTPRSSLEAIMCAIGN